MSPQGDISAAYSAESFPKIKVFSHEDKLFINRGENFSGPVGAGADCYVWIPANKYRGPEPRRYTYEGHEACFRSEVFKLGPKVVLVATDATEKEWRQGACALCRPHLKVISSDSLEASPYSAIVSLNDF